LCADNTRISVLNKRDTFTFIIHTSSQADEKIILNVIIGVTLLWF
jgi:hypothetical protein